MFTLQSHWNFLRELKLADPLKVSVQMLEVAQNKFQYISALYHGEKNYLAATAEFLVLHVDMETRKSTPFSPQKLSFLKKVQEEDSHGELSQYGGGIQLRSS